MRITRSARRRRDHRAVDDLVAVVAEDQQLVPFRDADLTLRLGDRVPSPEADLHIGVAHVDAGLVSPRRAQQRVAAGPGAVGVTLDATDQRVAEGEARERREHRFGAGDLGECVGDLGEGAQVLAHEQVGDIRVGIGRAEQQDHGLAAELPLELPVVDRDLRVGVEVAVLPGGELDLRRTDAEQHRDRADDDGDGRPLLAQRDGERPPERFHEASVGHPCHGGHAVREPLGARPTGSDTVRSRCGTVLAYGWRTRPPAGAALESTTEARTGVKQVEREQIDAPRRPRARPTAAPPSSNCWCRSSSSAPRWSAC